MEKIKDLLINDTEKFPVMFKAGPRVLEFILGRLHLPYTRGVCMDSLLISVGSR